MICVLGNDLGAQGLAQHVLQRVLDRPARELDNKHIIISARTSDLDMSPFIIRFANLLRYTKKKLPRVQHLLDMDAQETHALIKSQPSHSETNTRQTCFCDLMLLNQNIQPTLILLAPRPSKMREALYMNGKEAQQTQTTTQTIPHLPLGRGLQALNIFLCSWLCVDETLSCAPMPCHLIRKTKENEIKIYREISCECRTNKNFVRKARHTNHIPATHGPQTRP